jgi:hypothetical protein
MNVLNVNLKHLYQRRGIWLVYGFLGLFVPLSFLMAWEHPAAGKGRYIGLVLLAFVIGLLTTALPIEVLSKPFSYCLPGHRKVLRKLTFYVGIIANLLGALLFLGYPGLYSWQLILVVCSAFFAGLIFYWLGVWFAIGVGNPAALALVTLMPVVVLGAGLFGLHVVIERAIVGSPFSVIWTGVLVSLIAWFWLGSANRARRYCAVPQIGFFDFWNRDKWRRYLQLRGPAKWNRLKDHPRPWVERFFLNRMAECDRDGQGRYIWGRLYSTFGIAVSQWCGGLSGLFAASLMVCFLGYMGPGSTNILFVMPGLACAQMRLPVHSSMLISGGRKERFSAAMALVAAATLIITGMVTVIAALSVALAQIMPDITLRGNNFTFSAMNIELFFIPGLMMPIVSATQLLFHRRPVFALASIVPVFMLLFFGSIIWRSRLSWLMNPTYISGLLVLSWAAFATVLHHICMRRPLVGQTRTY